MKKLLILLLMAIMSVSACAEDFEDELLFADMLDPDMLDTALVTYDNVPWNFPIDIMDMDPTLIRLVNKSMFLEKAFVPADLVDMKSLKLDADGNNKNGGVRIADGPWQLQRECAEALVELCDAARVAGHELYLKSAYRSYKTQSYMYENRIKKYGYDDGWVTKPGASDHQTGLGCDVVPKNWTDRGMNEDMAKEEETQWMAEHCAEFGFILRYPADKEDVTKINYEPWHLRYVGKEAAAYIMQNGLCLEEFHDQLTAAIDEFLAAGGPEILVKEFIQVSAEDKYSRY